MKTDAEDIEIQNTIERIKLVIDREKLSYGAFADSVGMQQSTLSHILNGRNKPSLDVIKKIHQRYRNINLYWLLYGEEPMMVENGMQPTQLSHSNYPSLFDQKPVNPVDGQVGSEKRKEMPLEIPENTPKEPVIQEVRYIEKPSRKITEIKVFFDDNSYETFKSEK